MSRSSGHPRRRDVLIPAAFLAVLLASTCAQAQTAIPDDVLTIKRRTVSDNSQLGVRLGSFIINPGIELKTVFDDNIFRTRNDRKSDLISSVKPAIAVQSNWDRHGVFLGAEGDFGFFKNHDSENYVDYGFLASGQYDIAYETYLIAALRHTRRHEERGSLADLDGEPNAYRATSETLTFSRAPSRIGLKVEARNENVSLSTDDQPGRSNDDDFLDRNSQSLQTTVSYKFMPGNEVFVRGTYDTTEYNLLSGSDRSSDGINMRAGLNFDTTHRFSGSVYGGYMRRSFDDNNLDNTNDPYFGGSLTWHATPLTNVTVLVDKTFNDTTVAGAAGTIRTTRRVTAAHSFTTRLEMDATAGVDDSEYVGGTGDLNRDTRLWYGGVGTEYELREGLNLRAGYDYRERTSDRSADEYKDNRVMLSVVFMR